MKEKGDKYGLVRANGVSLRHSRPRRRRAEHDPHRDAARAARGVAKSQLEGKAQADRAVEFLKDEFPECFGDARVRAYGNPGIRQTRWIVGRHQLTAR